MNRRELIASAAALPVAGAAVAFPAGAEAANGTDARWAVYTARRAEAEGAQAAARAAYERLPEELRDPPFVLVRRAQNLPWGKARTVEAVEKARHENDIADHIFGPDFAARRAAHYDGLVAELKAKRAVYEEGRREYDALCEIEERAWAAFHPTEEAVLNAPVQTVTDVRRVLDLAEVLWKDCDDFESRCALAALDGLRAITGAEPLA